MEAINTNTIGANNVMRAAYENKVKKCILLSTDKAVYPINAMGMTKALSEKLREPILEFLLREKLFFVQLDMVMFVPRGSVIPLFIDQIKNNKPITITIKI